MDMEICCGGGANVLGPSDAVGAGGVGNGAVTTRAAGGAIWGSFVSSVGWLTVMSSATS